MENKFSNLICFQMATCFISENGLKIVVEDAKCVQVSAFIGADLFQVR